MSPWLTKCCESLGWQTRCVAWCCQSDKQRNQPRLKWVNLLSARIKALLHLLKLMYGVWKQVEIPPVWAGDTPDTFQLGPFCSV